MRDARTHLTIKQGSGNRIALMIQLKPPGECKGICKMKNKHLATIAVVAVIVCVFMVGLYLKSVSRLNKKNAISSLASVIRLYLQDGGIENPDVVILINDVGLKNGINELVPGATFRVIKKNGEYFLEISRESEIILHRIK